MKGKNHAPTRNVQGPMEANRLKEGEFRIVEIGRQYILLVVIPCESLNLFISAWFVASPSPPDCASSAMILF